MTQALAIFIGVLLLSFALVAAAWALSWRLVPAEGRRAQLFWLGRWSAKGLILPIAVWTLMNIGFSFEFQPFMPQVQAVRNSGGDWVSECLRVVAFGVFVVSSYWLATTVAWAVARAVPAISGESRKDLKGLCWTCGLGLMLPAAGVWLIGGWYTLGLAMSIVVAPLAGAMPSVVRPRKMPPMYSRAIARMKFGKYSEAEWEIIKELEKREDDFEGWMMLADLYANHFHDLREAEQTILEICEQPRTTPTQLSIALQRLADWHLKASEDPDAARRALQMICDRLPGTHLARMAQLRMGQLPASAQELREQRTVEAVPLPSLGDSLDEPERELPAVDRKEALERANACIERLKQDPNHPGAREKLARLLAEQLGQADVAIEQVMLLLNLPDQPETKRAQWLSMLAAWHLKYRQDAPTARNILERLLNDFPRSPEALAAQRRLRLLAESSASSTDVGGQ